MLLKMITAMLVSLTACEKPNHTALHHADTEVTHSDAETAPVASIEPDQEQPAASHDQQPAPPVSPVEALLDRLEASAADLRAFSADVHYEKVDALLGRKELRQGNLIYKHDAGSNEKSFAIMFDGAIINGVKRGDAKNYIFNGRWLAEVDHANKQFIKRELVPPGKQLDPLKLGEGPFPLPIGQKKADVMARFDVTAAELPQDGLLKDLSNVDGLSLTPKPGSKEARDYASVQLFYDRDTQLPVGIVTVEINDERKSVRLLNVKRNPELNAEQQSRLDIREPDPRQWKIDVRPWGE